MNRQRLKKALSHFAALSALGLATALSSTSLAADSEPKTTGTVSVPPELQEVIQKQGQALVVVGLKVDLGPTGALTLKERQAKIAQVQDQFLTDLKKVFQPSKERKFASIPHVAISINEAALQYIVQHPLVASIEMDTLSAPSF